MTNLPFFQAIAPNDEMAVANRMRDLALLEFEMFSTKGDAAKFICMFLYSQWLERTTKVLLTLYRRDVAPERFDLATENKKQYHSFIKPLHEIWTLGSKKRIAPGFWPQAKSVLDNSDVRDLLNFVQAIADAKVGRYSNLETLAGNHENDGFMMGVSTILTTAATNRLGVDSARLDAGDFDVVAEHSQRFFSYLTNVLTFILHFPIGQGVFGDKTRQLVAFQFNPTPPKLEVFEYLMNSGSSSSPTR